MKNLLIVLALLIHPLAISAETKYLDRPIAVPAKLNEILARYRTIARSKLEYFNKRFENDKRSSFYVTTIIREENAKETVFVKLNKIDSEMYFGEIANNSANNMKFKSGDQVTVAVDDIDDWLIVSPDGEEEGNLRGKILDLIQIGKAAFILEMLPKNGKWSEFNVVSVINPLTKQQIIEVVPQEVISNIESKIGEKLGAKVADRSDRKYVYIFAQFPGWEIISEPRE